MAGRAGNRAQGAQALGDLLAESRRQWRRAYAAREGLDLPVLLAGCLGSSRAAAVGFGGVRRGVLTLTVDSAALLAEMGGFRRTSLLQAVQGAPGGERIRDLKLVAVSDAEGPHGR